MAKERSTPTPTAPKQSLNDLIELHAQACAEDGDKAKAGYYRDLLKEMAMPTMQAVQKKILEDGISGEEIVGLLLGANVRG